ncbi:MAG: hypothetical protein IPH88_02150 [Bacteroidales bacterium]|nr:hypothetical protein [Bacteroidales bacterium]
MKSKSILFLLSCLLLIGQLSFGAGKPETKAISLFPLDGNGLNTIPGGGKAKIKGGKTVPSHDGTKAGAVEFSIDIKRYNSSERNIVFPVDISPAKFPKLTITAWVKASNVFRKMTILANSEDKYGRGVIIDKHDELYRWGVNCGKDGMLYGPPLVDEWVFIALIYDDKNQAVRFVLNDQVYASRATSRSQSDKLFVGTLNGAVDDVRIFDYILTQEEIEALSGKLITGNVDELEIKDRYGYRERMKMEKENSIQVGDVYITDGNGLQIYDTTKLQNTIALIAEGDSLSVISKLKDGWFRVSYQDGKTGYATRSSILKNAYPKGGSSFLHKFSYEFSHIFDFTKARSWILVGIFAVIIFLVKRYFSSLDRFLLRLRKGRDEFSAGGSKSEPSYIKANILSKIYPITRYPWYPMLTGVLLGITIFVGSFWDTYEMEWFYNEGFNILPIGYDRPVHWFLYGMSMLTILLTLSWIVESFVIAGPWVGLLRIFLLIIINFMSWMVTFFLLILVAIVVLIMLGLYVFGNTVGSGKYKCPSCGRSFSASAGSSVSCPGCGASLST